MSALDRWVKACAIGLASAGLIALLLFAAATLADGLLRTFFDRPIDAVRDVGPFVVAAAISACFPLAIYHGANIRIDLVRSWLGPRAGSVLEKAIGVLVLIVLAAMARQLFIYAGDSRDNGDSTVLLGIKTAPFWFFVAAMLAVTTLTQAVILLTRRPAPPHAPFGPIETLMADDEGRSAAP